MKTKTLRILVVLGATLAVAAIAAPQVREAIKIFGVAAAVRQFSPDINRAINGLSGHKDSDSAFTKVVPIITVGINSRNAVGAAQVTGSRRNVERVQAVAAPEADLFGREIRIRALIPVGVSEVRNRDDIKAIQGVGVSGIVDLKL
ncbi:MAG: hypothetical protein MUC92_08325 [Fimbriimonadaceae bacterium]|jgi:hypothetical protein|nr:hypothetical protein [Fimbriimonadaceae bacterium]